MGEKVLHEPSLSLAGLSLSADIPAQPSNFSLFLLIS